MYEVCVLISIWNYTLNWAAYASTEEFHNTYFEFPIVEQLDIKTILWTRILLIMYERNVVLKKTFI